MVKMRCNKVCKTGGDNPSCKVRICARKKSFEGCWGCDRFEDCEKMNFLNGVHGNANIVNLKAIRKNGTEKFLKAKKLWYSD